MARNKPAYRVHEPCSIDPGKMANDGPNRLFCQQCQKHVHDLRGRPKSESTRLLRQHGGPICAIVEVDERGDTIFAPEPPSRFRILPKWLLAAGMLVVATPPLFARNSSPSEWVRQATQPTGGQDNHRITAVLFDQFQQEVNVPVQVDLFVNGAFVKRIKVEHALLTLDLKGIANPEDHIRLEVKESKHHSRRRITRVMGQSYEAQLSMAQNLKINLKVYTSIKRGHFFRRRTSGGKYY